MSMLTRHFWVASSPTGYFRVLVDNQPYYEAKFKDASRYDSVRALKDAIIETAATSGFRPPELSLERMVEVCSFDKKLGNFHVSDKQVAVLRLLREKISRSASRSYQWLMSSPSIDYTEWKFMAALPEWEFSDPDERTVEQRLKDVGLPAVISNHYVFLKREEDFSVLKLLFENVLIFVEIESGSILVDNRK